MPLIKCNAFNVLEKRFCKFLIDAFLRKKCYYNKGYNLQTPPPKKLVFEIFLYSHFIDKHNH